MSRYVLRHGDMVKYAFLQARHREFHMTCMCHVLGGESEWILCQATAWDER